MAADAKGLAQLLLEVDKLIQLIFKILKKEIKENEEYYIMFSQALGSDENEGNEWEGITGEIKKMIKVS